MWSRVALFVVTLTAALAAGPISKADGPYSWHGLYGGIHGGYGWGDIEGRSFDLAGVETVCVPGPCRGADLDGGFGGAQLGYNFTVFPGVLLGVEADISAAGIDGSTFNCSATGCATNDVDVEALATVRGRLGFASGSWLFYATGGWAAAKIGIDRTLSNTGNVLLDGTTSSSNGWENGWVWGGGIEWAIAANTSLKLEYQHLELDTFSRTATYALAGATRITELDANLDTVRLGLNVRFDHRREAESLK